MSQTLYSWSLVEHIESHKPEWVYYEKEHSTDIEEINETYNRQGIHKSL